MQTVLAEAKKRMPAGHTLSSSLQTPQVTICFSYLDFFMAARLLLE